MRIAIGNKLLTFSHEVIDDKIVVKNIILDRISNDQGDVELNEQLELSFIKKALNDFNGLEDTEVIFKKKANKFLNKHKIS